MKNPKGKLREVAGPGGHRAEEQAARGGVAASLREVVDLLVGPGASFEERERVTMEVSSRIAAKTFRGDS